MTTLIARANLLVYRRRLLNWTQEDELVSKPIRTAVASARNLQARVAFTARRTTSRHYLYLSGKSV